MTALDPRTISASSLHELLVQRESEHGDNPYVIAVRTGVEVSYAELRRRADEWCSILRSRGVEPGTRVGLVMADPVEFAVAFFGIIAAGCWVAPFDANVPSASHSRLLERCEELDIVAIASDLRPLATDIAWIGVPLSESAPTSPLNTRLGGVLLSSSGTTGTPKVISLSTRQLLYTATLIAKHNHLTASDRGFNPLPLFHINAEVVAVLATFVAGASLVLEARFHRTDFWGHIDRHQVTWINAVPAIVSRLVSLNSDEHVPERVRFIRSASAPLPPSILEEFEATIGVPVIESYGMTEAASQICANPLDGVRKVGSVGLPVGVDLRVIAIDDDADEDPSLVPHAGHIEIRGDSIIQSYVGVGYEERFDENGWLRTGDLGYVDDDGYVFLVGRADDVINRGGEKMFPREIEEVIVAVPGVLCAAVIGAPDEVFGQIPVSYVQLDDVDHTTELDDIRRKVAAINSALVVAFPRERRPVSINVVLAMPTLATGKIQKHVLRKGDVVILIEEMVQ